MISGLARRSRSACSLSSAASFTSSLPVPRQAISAGEKLGQRQAAAGTSRQWVPANGTVRQTHFTTCLTGRRTWISSASSARGIVSVTRM